MSVHKGQTAEVTANSLKARVSPGGAQAKDAKGKLVTRPDGFRFKATDVSSDWPSRNRVGEARIDDITRRWGLRYLGWAGDMAPGGDIPGVKN
jgi:hypothetical protein